MCGRVLSVLAALGLAVAVSFTGCSQPDAGKGGTTPEASGAAAGKTVTSSSRPASPSTGRS